jgi:hypothetical protein
MGYFHTRLAYEAMPFFRTFPVENNDGAKREAHYPRRPQ